MVFQYIAYNTKGEVVKGKLPAASEEAANDLLGYAGYQAISLKPYIPFLNVDKLTSGLFQVKPGDIILVYRQMAMLLESGIDIVTALELLREQASNRALRKVIGGVIDDLRAGHQLSRALSKHPHVFSPIYCKLIGVGEQSGDLETVLRQVADYMEKEVTTAKETKSALMYPVITSVVTVVVIAILVTFVLPGFGSLYSSLGIAMPASAQLLIDLSAKLKEYWTFLMVGALAALSLTCVYIKTAGGRARWDRLLLRLPLLGHVCHLNELARICRSMSLLFRTGLPLTEILPLLIDSSRNRALSQAMANVQQDMIKGEGISKPMAKNSLFLPMMVQMVRVGEETGNLDATLLAVARSYETEAEDKMRSLIALIQPVMTLTIGLIIAGMAFSLVSAMYSIYGQGF